MSNRDTHPFVHECEKFKTAKTRYIRTPRAPITLLCGSPPRNLSKPEIQKLHSGPGVDVDVHRSPTALAERVAIANPAAVQSTAHGEAKPTTQPNPTEPSGPAHTRWVAGVPLLSGRAALKSIVPYTLRSCETMLEPTKILRDWFMPRSSQIHPMLCPEMIWTRLPDFAWQTSETWLIGSWDAWPSVRLSSDELLLGDKHSECGTHR